MIQFKISIIQIIPAKYLNCGVTFSAIENKKIGSKINININIKIFLLLIFFYNKKNGIIIINNNKLFSTL